jgi:hypothetical protein
MTWWGAGPKDFAACSKAFPAAAVVVLDLNRKLEARLASSVLSPYLVGLRAIRAPSATLGVVLNPHRVQPYTLRALGGRYDRLVAWLGDEPSHLRPFGPAAATFYDWIIAPDPAWLGAFPGDKCRILTWPHLVPRHLHGPTGPSDGGLVFVGTAYARRVEIARLLRARGLQVSAIGSTWPSDIPHVQSMGRLETISWLKRRGAVVLNAPHSQMLHTLNPLFFDLAAAGVPQIVESNAAPRAIPGSIFSSTSSLSVIGLDHIARASGVVGPLQQEILSNHDVDSRIREIMSW